MRKKCLYKKPVLRGAWAWWISDFKFDPDSSIKDRSGEYDGQYCHLACINEGWIAANLMKFPEEQPRVGYVTLEDAAKHFNLYFPGIDEMREALGEEVVKKFVGFFVELTDICQRRKELAAIHKAHTRRQWKNFPTLRALDLGAHRLDLGDAADDPNEPSTSHGAGRLGQPQPGRRAPGRGRGRGAPSRGTQDIRKLLAETSNAKM